MLKHLVSPDAFVTMEAGFSGKDLNIVGRAVTIVDGEHEEVAAWNYLVNSRARSSEHFSEGGGGLKREVEELTKHSQIFNMALDFGIRGFAWREFTSKMVWRKKDKVDKIVVASEPVEGA